jgi:hypothetical protein
MGHTIDQARKVLCAERSIAFLLIKHQRNPITLFLNIICLQFQTSFNYFLIARISLLSSEASFNVQKHICYSVKLDFLFQVILPFTYKQYVQLAQSRHQGV